MWPQQKHGTSVHHVGYIMHAGGRLKRDSKMSFGISKEIGIDQSTSRMVAPLGRCIQPLIPGVPHRPYRPYKRVAPSNGFVLFSKKWTWSVSSTNIACRHPRIWNCGRGSKSPQNLPPEAIPKNSASAKLEAWSNVALFANGTMSIGFIGSRNIQWIHMTAPLGLPLELIEQSTCIAGVVIGRQHAQRQRCDRIWRMPLEKSMWPQPEKRNPMKLVRQAMDMPILAPQVWVFFWCLRQLALQFHG